MVKKSQNAVLLTLAIAINIAGTIATGFDCCCLECGCRLDMAMSVPQSLSRLCQRSRICPPFVQTLSRLWPCPMYDYYMSSKSNVCPRQIQFLFVQSLTKIFPVNFPLMLVAMDIVYRRLRTN